MTRKEYYTLLVQSATDGTFPSVQAGLCRYRIRGVTGKVHRCAAGLLIPETKYTPALEGKSALSLKEVVQLPSSMTWDELKTCQRIHDQCADLSWDAQRFIREIQHRVFVEEATP